jgi:hypothetical protein
MDNKDKNRNMKKGRSRHHENHVIHRHSIIDSQGPDRKMKGTALHLFERYTALARDAEREGNFQEAENFFQHAEHYRMMNAGFKEGPSRDKKASSKESIKEDTKKEESTASMMILPPKKTAPVDDSV